MKKRACECGEVEYDTFDALAHTPVTDAAVDATCTTSGKTEGSHCSVCGMIITVQNTIAPVGHCCDSVTVLQEAFCNLDGTRRYSCTNAGCSYYYDESFSLPELNSGEIYDRAVQYTGKITVFDRLGNIYHTSSAFVISPDGKILTSMLSIDNAFSAVFVLGDIYYDVTEVLAYNEAIHVAVLKVDATDLPYADLCVREPVNAEPIYTVGAPSGYGSSISAGVISNTTFKHLGYNFIQHDINASSGYVGSPIINRFGEVIGVNIGYLGDDYIGVAARVEVLDSLDYSTPISMAEYGNITFTPVEELAYWVQIYSNGQNGNDIAYVLQGNGFYYSLGYDTVSGYTFAEGYWEKDENYQLYVRIIFNNSNGTYQYYATLTNGAQQNEVYGFIDAASYTKSTVLTYDTFYGRYWTEAELMALYSGAVYDTIGFFSYCLDTYFDTLTLETFGFTEVSYDRDEEALTKLQNFVIANGMYDDLTGSYVLSGGSQMGEDLMQFNISYNTETGDTVVSLHYALANGSTFSSGLTLNATEDGNRFYFMCSMMNGEEYTVQNIAWGYLDANSFTRATKLTCYEFDGMNEYEDGLLTDYMSLLDYMMRLLNDSVMPTVDPSLSIKDLGFYFYFG